MQQRLADRLDACRILPPSGALEGGKRGAFFLGKCRRMLPGALAAVTRGTLDAEPARRGEVSADRGVADRGILNGAAVESDESAEANILRCRTVARDGAAGA